MAIGWLAVCSIILTKPFFYFIYMVQVFVWSIIYQPSAMSSYMVYICKALCMLCHKALSLCRKANNWKTFQNNNFPLFSGILLFSEVCWSHFDIQSGVNAIIMFLQKYFQLKLFVFHKMLLVSKSHFIAITFCVIVFDLQQISQSFRSKRTMLFIYGNFYELTCIHEACRRN